MNLGRDPLELPALRAIATSGPRLALDAACAPQLDAAVAAIERIVEKGDPAYGIANLPTLADQRDPVKYLEEKLEVEPLGGEHADEVVKGLNRVARFLRGRLGKHIEMKFTPDLKFIHDESFDAASHIDRLFDDPRVRADVARADDQDED